MRRTSSIDTVWPDGRTGTMSMTGRARDAATSPSGGSPIVLAEDEFRARVQWDRTIVSIEATPERTAIASLVGARGGGHLRAALDQALPAERANATPLHLILDDMSGASLVAGWAWSRWTDEWQRSLAAAAETSGAARPLRRSMEGICSGFRPGSSALNPDGTSSPSQSATDVVDLRNADDPQGWHAFTVQEGVGMRRARRIDIWLDGELICIDSAFQDSATNPRGGRTAVHEYLLTAAVDLQSMTLVALKADPRVLPYRECPTAAGNVQRLVGAPLKALREQVLVDLRGTAGCTHLNDALRALAEVPALVDRLLMVRASGWQSTEHDR